MSIEQIRARSTGSVSKLTNGVFTMHDGLAAVGDRKTILTAVDAVLAEVAEWDKSAEISDNTANDLHRQRNVEAAGLHVYHAELTRNHAARIRTAITEALEGTE